MLCCQRLAAFETLLEDGELINEDGESLHLPATFRLVFAQLAASLNRLADAVDPSSSGSSKQGAAGAFCSAVSLFGRTWEACREELMEEIAGAVRHHWQRVMQAQAVAGSMGNMQEVGSNNTVAIGWFL
jgi:phage terminase large subunit-like protein